MKKILISVFTLAALVALAGCQKEPKVNTTPMGDVTTLQATDVRDTRATIQGQLNISSEMVAEYGFIFSEEPVTAVTDELFDRRISVTNADNDGIFSYRAENLTNIATSDGKVTGKNYYYRAYMINPAGKAVYGNQIIFQTMPVSITDPDAPSGWINTIGSRSVQAGLKVAVNLGVADTLGTGFKPVITLLPSQIGYYVWQADEDGNPVGDPLQRVSPFTEQQTKVFAGSYPTVAAGQTPVFQPYDVDVTVKGLDPATRYSIAPFVIVGAYFSINAYPAPSFMTTFSNEVVGGNMPFTTLPIDPPTVQTLAQGETTPTSVMMQGTLTSDGNDEFCQFGFKIGASADLAAMEGPIWADSRDQDGNFTLLKRELKANTTYYYAAAARNLKSDAYGDVMSFTTMPVSQPIIGEVAPMEYAWRVDNTTPNSAKIRASILSDGGETLSEYGVMFGESPTDLYAKSYTTIIHPATGLFYVDISGLNPGREYYYRVYATNSSGRVEGSQVLSFRTPLGGIALYYYPDNVFKGNPPVWTRVKQYTDNQHNLTYYEADPIQGSSGTYYFLDRNLGATLPFTEDTYVTPLPSADSTQRQYKYIGYYYQHGCQTPSATPDMALSGALSSNYGWDNNATTHPLPLLDAGPSWPQENLPGSPAGGGNPCPQGYDVPTLAQMTDVINAKNGATLQGWFAAIRLGVSGERAPGNGNPTAAGLRNSEANFWLKETSANGNNGMVFHVGLGSPPVAVGTGNVRSRYEGVSVRCVRVVNP